MHTLILRTSHSQRLKGHVDPPDGFSRITVISAEMRHYTTRGDNKKAGGLEGDCRGVMWGSDGWSNEADSPKTRAKLWQRRTQAERQFRAMTLPL